MIREENFLGIFGHTNLDIIMSLDRLPEPNTSIEVVGEKRYFGGTGGNIARCCAALGTPVALASFVGDDFPDDYMKALSSDGVDIKDLVRVEGFMTPTCWIMSDRKGNQFAIINQGPMKDPIGFPPQEHTLDSAELVHFSTGNPLYYLDVKEKALKAGKTIAFDPAQEIHYIYDHLTFTGMLEGSEFFFCNESELAAAMEFLKEAKKEDAKKEGTGMEGTGMEEAGNDTVQGAENLLELTGNVVLTLGDRGCRIFEKNGKVHSIPAEKVREPVDPTGAGDAFRGGFYAAMARGLSLEMCGRVGCCTAASVISFPGPQPMPGARESYPDFDCLMERAKNLE